MRASESRRKLLDLSHEVRNCSYALTMTAAGLKAGADPGAPRSLRLIERCANQLVAVSRALDEIAAAQAAPSKPVPRRRGTVKASV